MADPADAAPSPDALLDAAGTALFDLGRAFTRLSFRRQADRPGQTDRDRSHVHVVLAVETADSAGRDVSIGAVADHLAIDPSTASRLVARSTAAGYLRRDTAPDDGRLAQLALTSTGRALAADARRYQRAVFDDLTRDWTDAERFAFARLFVRFAEGVIAARTDTEDAADRPVTPVMD